MSLDNINWDEYFDKLKKEESQKQKKIAEFKQNRMEQCMKEIFDFLKKTEYIDNEELSYTEDKCNFKYDEFEMLFDLLYEYAENNKLLVHAKDDTFGEINFVLNYNNNLITGRIAYGQGTMNQLRLNYETCLNEDYKTVIFTWNDFITNEKREIIKIDKQDFIEALQGWYYGLDEYNNTDNKEFNDMLKKYDIDIKNIR